MVYYNEIDEFAAERLSMLIAARLIAPGVVDQRSIEDVRPGDLRGFKQCHFFAGIGVWSHALRAAGWPDARGVWTGSCPCQPFSTAGKGRGVADERHLWPHWFQLIGQCRPPVVLGEQVASADGLDWLDLVCADLEGASYAVGAVDLCAAGVGAPHIRQRLYWVADARGERRDGFAVRVQPGPEGSAGAEAARGRSTDWVALSAGQGSQGSHGSGQRVEPQLATSERGRGAGGLADADGRIFWDGDVQPSRKQRLHSQDGSDVLPTGGRSRTEVGSRHGTRPTNGHWRDADWLACRDGKWRPVEPGTFPLAHGVAGRVGLLRTYGNAIVAPVAEAFIRAVMR